MYSQSGLQQRLAQLHQSTGIPYCTYSDSAYPCTRYCIPSFKGPTTAAQRAVNHQQSHVRISVEWSFALSMNQWAYLADERHLKVGEQPVAKLYMVGAILHNLHTIAFEGNLISQYFDCPLPADMTMYSYLNN